MAKKITHTVPFHQVHVSVAGDILTMRFQKKVKGGTLNVGKVVCDRKDKAKLNQDCEDVYAALVAD